MGVFLEESVEVSRPLEAIWGYFIGDASWFAPLATAAEEDGEALYFRVGPSWEGVRVSRKVQVSLGPPRNRGEAIVVPISWQASTAPGLFPTLDADLEVASTDAEHCLLTLTGSYEPPLGELGRQLDRILLHRIALSTARSFLDRVADRLETESRVKDLRQGWD
jgi:hypothetical protein